MLFHTDTASRHESIRAFSSMKSIVFLAAISFCLLAASCGKDPASPSASGAGDDAQPLTEAECSRLIKREFDILPKPGSPAHTRLLASCNRGSGTYNREYFNCVFSSRYAEARACADKVKGIDRSKRDPLLEGIRTGEKGHYSRTAASAVATLYRGTDYRTTFDRSALRLYLDERDRAFTTMDDVPPGDRDTPRYMRTRSVADGEDTYWVVEAGFAELQLAQVLKENSNGIEQVHCAMLGSDFELDLGSGYCGALIGKHFGATLSR